MAAQQPEPWLRGSLPHVHPAVMPVFFSFSLVREDLNEAVDGLTEKDVWLRPFGLTPLGFHLKHIAGSVDRLSTYLIGFQLSREQLMFLGSELEPDTPMAELLSLVESQLSRSEQKLELITPAVLFEPRTVGREKRPTTVQGLLVHLAEHTQRHLGQAVTTAHLLKKINAKD